MVDSLDQPAWVYQMLVRLKKIEGVAISTIILNTSKSTSGVRSKLNLRNINSLAYEVYRRFEKVISKPSPDAFASKNIKEILPDNIRILSIIPLQKGHIDIFNSKDISTIKSEGIDVLVRLGFRILKGDILECARYGIWSYHHGDNRVNRGGPAGVWEFIKSQKETGSVLQILTEDLDAGNILYRSWAHTHRDFLNASINKYYWKTAAFIPREIERLISLGPEMYFKEVNSKNSHPEFYSNKLYKKPKNLEFISGMVRKWFKLGMYFIGRIIEKEQWFLLYRFDPKGRLSTIGYQFKPINPPKDRYWADPCVIFQDGKYFIFFEDFFYKENAGQISMLTITKDGSFSEPVCVLKRPYHLSYPFVFKHNGQYYMIPETQNNMTIELYKAINFPGEWSFVMNLMENVWACDTTIFEKDGRVWMFTCMKEFEGDTCHDELFIFYSDSLETTNWRPHAKNPVVSDVKNARPAGGFLEIKNKLYRVSQNCAEAYGKSVTLHEVKILNPDEYKEEVVSELLPQWKRNITRVHTFSFAEGLTVIDGFRKVSKI